MTPPANETRTRLLRLADDCEERARLAHNCDARSRFHTAAADARLIARTPSLCESELRFALDAATWQARFASFLNGDTLPESEQAPYSAFAAPDAHCTPSPSASPPVMPEQPARPRPAHLLNARQLAPLFGMSERGARKAIERGVRRGMTGFHRDGALWLAERDAFARLRLPGAELGPRAVPMITPGHDKADHP